MRWLGIAEAEDQMDEGVAGLQVAASRMGSSHVASRQPLPAVAPTTARSSPSHGPRQQYIPRIDRVRKLPLTLTLSL
ncbi:hypothetical protein NXC12_CH00924 [Rhizobium etli]|uniref:Uncharacterized protein n=1 Tax=Rhizobium etli TaxID=29449 RepID=A0AAN1BCW5_RHIET|nr:hypothetical protein NXC12_CH00924 [Rhizobium etli]